MMIKLSAETFDFFDYIRKIPCVIIFEKDKEKS